MTKKELQYKYDELNKKHNALLHRIREIYKTINDTHKKTEPKPLFKIRL